VKRKEEGITQNVDIIEEEDTTDMTANADAVAAVDVIVNVIVLVDITVDIPVEIKKWVGEDSGLKKKKEKNSRSTKKN